MTSTLFEYISIVFLAMTPVVELRGSIPLAIGMYGMDWELALILSVIGNIVPPIILIPFLFRVSTWLSARSTKLDRFFKWLFSRTRARHEGKFTKFRDFALILLVALPLPMTGAWTASAAAFVFGIPLRRAFPLIFIGVILAGVIVTLISLQLVSFM